MKRKKVNKNTVKYKAKLARRERNKLDFEWSQKVKTRDNNCCAICGKTGLIHTHHIIPREYEPTRHLLENGISLCPSHHKYSYDISAHKNSFAFYEWLKNTRKLQYLYLLQFLKNVGMLEKEDAENIIYRLK